uniref:Addiction module component n=1 Tax=Candidatus Kentrum sp. TUN TaxID=2126343 RepID=A0A450ZVA0_9GAMM|nr:MAG: Putative addiction module component [Candidatus Kentron sp. TUN]
MRRDIEALTTELIGLPKRERLEIARFLLFIDNRSSDSDDIESVWEEEITDRVRAVDAGTAVGLDYDTAMGELERRFAS